MPSQSAPAAAAPFKTIDLSGPSSPAGLKPLERRLRSFGRLVSGSESYNDRSSTTYQIVTLLASLVAITIFGLAFHLMHPEAAQSRASERMDQPPPAPPPPPTIPTNTPLPPPSVPSPLTPPSPPPLRPIDWWQSRRTVQEMVQSGWIELIFCFLLFCVTPAVVVWLRRARMQRRRARVALSHARLQEEPTSSAETNAGPVRGPQGERV